MLSLTHPTVCVTSTPNVSCSTLHAHTSAPQTPALRTFLNPFSYDEASLVLLSPQGFKTLKGHSIQTQTNLRPNSDSATHSPCGPGRVSQPLQALVHNA